MTINLTEVKEKLAEYEEHGYRMHSDIPLLREAPPNR